MKKTILSLLLFIIFGVSFGFCFNSTSFTQLNKIHVDSTNYLDYVNGYNYTLGTYTDVGLYCAVLENFKYNGGYTGTVTTKTLSIGLSVNTVLSSSTNNGFARYSLKSFNSDYWEGSDLVYCISKPYTINSIVGNFNSANDFKIFFSDYGLEFDMGVYYLNENFSCPSCSSCESSLSSCQSSLSSCQSDLLSCQSQSCDSMTSSECQTEYNLIPVSSVDSSYCLTNNLCPLISTGEDFNWSALFINNVQHNSAGLISITIPEEINWDYTGNSEVFDLQIDGYNVDPEYIEGIINTQKEIPNEVDFNNIITVLLPLFVPGLIIILFIYFAFRFIKKIF